MARIFISYRRNDSAYVAATLKEKIQQRFGEDSVFLDIDNIPLGVDFRRHIGDAVGQCDVLLVLIGDNWLGDNGVRLRAESDFVRIEIESALQREIPVVPVLLDRAEMPPSEMLPPSLQNLVYRNCAEIRAGKDFYQHVDRLLKGLDFIISPPPSSTRTQAQTRGSPASATAPKPRTAAGKQTSASPAPSPLELLQNSLRNENDRDLYLAPQIPPSILSNATESYAEGVKLEEVLLLYNNAVFGSGGRGMIITSNAVYWRNTLFGKGSLPIKEIRSVEVHPDGTAILINRRRVPLGRPRAGKIGRFLHDLLKS